MKQAVKKSCRYEPIFTEVFYQWALHNQISLLTARVAKPKDKAAVENDVKIAYRRIYAPLRNEIFYSLACLNTAIREKLEQHHQRAFQRKDYSRLQCFQQEEFPLLQPLPASDYLLHHSAQAKVQKNYHVTLGEDWHHYSVPYTYIGKTLQLVYDTDTVEIYLAQNRIALHKRNYKKHGYTTVKEHMPEGHQKYFEQKGWNAEYFLSQAAKVGAYTHQYIEGVLKAKHFTEQTYNACLGILRLGKTHGALRLEAACTRALKGQPQRQQYSYRTIYNILINKLDEQPDPLQRDMFDMPAHENIRGAEHYQ